MAKILNKIGGTTSLVPDKVCEACSQCWEGECRAYQMPHSTEEQIQRSVLQPWDLPLCMEKRPGEAVTPRQ